MKFGDTVILVRGSRGRFEGPGHERELKAKYVGARGNMVRCKLLEDDHSATIHPYLAGEFGWWHGRSFIKPVKE